MAVVSRLNPNNADLVRVQDNIKRVVDPVLANPLLQGKLVKSISVTAATQFQLQHGLGRQPVGYFITRTQGSSSVTLYESATQPNPSSYLLCVPSATGTIDVWVF